MTAMPFTAIDVLETAIALRLRRSFDCPFCVIAAAKTVLDHQHDTELSPLEAAIYFRMEMPIDRPLVLARAAMRPFLTEIAGCPSRVTRRRTIEMFREALKSLGQLKKESA